VAISYHARIDRLWHKRTHDPLRNGEPILEFIEKRLALMLFVAFATIVFGFVLWFYVV
jgi:hypothetical protein